MLPSHHLPLTLPLPRRRVRRAPARFRGGLRGKLPRRRRGCGRRIGVASVAACEPLKAFVRLLAPPVKAHGTASRHY